MLGLKGLEFRAWGGLGTSEVLAIAIALWLLETVYHETLQQCKAHPNRNPGMPPQKPMKNSHPEAQTAKC